jgi:hypothetical protein
MIQVALDHDKHDQQSLAKLVTTQPKVNTIL